MNAVFRDGEDWTEQSLTPQKRELLLITEQRLAGLEVFRLDQFEAYRDQILRVWQGLGRFYTSKFRSGKERHDWERAHFYFKKAVAYDSASAVLWRDYGVHLCGIEVASTIRPRWIAEEREIEDLRGQAEAAFHRSLELQADEPGALFGLIWLHYERGNYEFAIELNRRLARKSNWVPLERKKYLIDGWRNSACCRIRNSELAALVFQDLENARSVATEEGILDQWRAEVREDEDIAPFLSDHPAEAANLLS
jgi:tetratricopeptide (TPR) repeat protein